MAGARQRQSARTVLPIRLGIDEALPVVELFHHKGAAQSCKAGFRRLRYRAWYHLAVPGRVTVPPFHRRCVTNKTAWILVCFCLVLAVGAGPAHAAGNPGAGTPPETVATYDTLADT